MTPSLLGDPDLAFLASRGISADEATRQIALLQRGATAPDLVRAATAGDGILRPAPAALDALLPALDGAAAQGGLCFFVPASGAASRMFAGPRQLLAGAHPDPAAERARLSALARAPAVRRSLQAQGVNGTDPLAVARFLCEVPPTGSGWADRPKAFVPFHEDPRPEFPLRTPLEEQVAEAAVVLGAGGRGTLHFTLPDAWPLPAGWDRTAAALSHRHGGAVSCSSSVQAGSTDTLSLAPDGQLVRDAAGRPVLRAGGHGSLLPNLEATPGRVVLVKNIDNIQPEARRPWVVPWRRRLAALALALREAADRLLDGGDAAPLRALADRLGAPLPGDPAALRLLVDRPLRVAGMVPNAGEPGGGPFWVRAPEGERLEIVEQSEVAAAQRPLLAASTHFNPVELACAFRRASGAPWPLAEFVDPSRAFLSKKPSPQGELRVLERPGLWNGAMSRWWTLFLELPLDTFLPAKTVHDLAHPWRTGARA